MNSGRTWRIALTPEFTMSDKVWYVMRDLTRRNANSMAHQRLAQLGFEVFTPMKEMVMTIGGRRQRRNVPVIQDLLFVNEAKDKLDIAVARIPGLQYRYVRGRSIHDPMYVRADDMHRFIAAVSSSDNPRYFLPGELTDSMIGRKVRIIGGPLDGYSGHLLSIKGLRKKRLIVEIPNLISSAVEVSPDFIQAY